MSASGKNPWSWFTQKTTYIINYSKIDHRCRMSRLGTRIKNPGPDQDQGSRLRAGDQKSIKKWISFGKVGDWGYVAKLTRNTLLLRKTESFLFYPLSICAMWFYRKYCILIRRKYPRETCSKSLLTQSPWPCGQPPSSIWKSQMPGGSREGGDRRAGRQLEGTSERHASNGDFHHALPIQNLYLAAKIIHTHQTQKEYLTDWAC